MGARRTCSAIPRSFARISARWHMLALEGLVARYGPVTALSGVSLTVESAEFVCLIGANGAGKSTTLKAISGLVPAAAGRIRFDGQDIAGLPAQEILKRGI